MPPTVVDRLFVYGTLRAGQRARRMIDDHVRASEPARCRGTLYAFAAGYPGLVLDGDTVIVGELVHLDDLAAALPLLDGYEGEDFTRILTEVEAGTGIERAWVYVLSDAAMAASGTVIASGDWVSVVGSQPPPER